MSINTPIFQEYYLVSFANIPVRIYSAKELKLMLWGHSPKTLRLLPFFLFFGKALDSRLADKP